MKLHADEVETSVELVRRLVTSQFPQWAELSLTPVRSDGTDNAMYRLGDRMAVRLPRRPSAAGQIQKECDWLPRLAPSLPAPVPVPLGQGHPAFGYPFQWSVCDWLNGDTVVRSEAADSRAMATDLATFVVALRTIDATGAPPPGAHNSGRGAPLATRDRATRKAIAAAHDMIDAEAATAAWERDLSAPAWHGAPAWIHGDLSAGNLLAAQGKLCGVIDFGCLGAGDPACDLMPAWNLFRGEAREAFRAATLADDAAWARGRGWALSVALIQLPYYRQTHPAMVAGALTTIDEALSDHMFYRRHS